MSDAIIGMFESTAEANSAREKLIAAGVPASDIRISGTGNTSAASGVSAAYEDKGFWESVKEMFGAGDETDADQHVSYYTEGARRGGVVLTVNASDARADQVADILRSSGAVDIDAKASEWKSGGWAGYDATAETARSTRPATAGEATAKVDLVKEDLTVGKRVVNRGGVRIVKRVIDRPVEQDVTLREERITVDRRAADRPLQGVDATEAFKDQTFELTESAEEAVAAKSARVVGEVAIGKTVEERKETVRDTLRETDVQVEKLPGQETASSTKVVEQPGRTDTSRTTKAGS